MKTHLMHRDADFDLAAALPPEHEGLTRDLGLASLFAAMAGDDQIIYDVARRAMVLSLTDIVAITYRQDILRDCLTNRQVVRQIYALAVETIASERKNYFGLMRDYPRSILHRSITVMTMFVDALARMRRIAGAQSERFLSEGFHSLFSMLKSQIGDEYLKEIRAHLKQMAFNGGILLSAELGEACKGSAYVLRQPNRRQHGWLAALFAKGPPSFTFWIPERDEAGGRAISELNDRGLNLVANAAAQSNDHILSFFRMVQVELAAPTRRTADAFCAPRADYFGRDSGLTGGATL